MNKSEIKVRNYIINEVNRSFTWDTDIAEHTLWGFKRAPYKTLSRALKTVNKVIDTLVKQEIIIVIDGRVYKK